MNLQAGDICICIHPEAMGMECELIEWKNKGDPLPYRKRREVTESGWHVAYADGDVGVMEECYLIKKPKPDSETRTEEKEIEHV